MIADNEALKLSTPEDSSANAVLEMIASERPDLLLDVPFILSLCEIYRQRKLAKEEILK